MVRFASYDASYFSTYKWLYCLFFAVHPFSLTGTSGGGQGGREPGEQGAGGVRETGEERAGGGISTRAESGREIQKGKLLLFVTAYFQSKKRNQERFS